MNTVLKLKSIDGSSVSSDCSFDFSDITSKPENDFLSQYHYDMKIFADTKYPLANTLDVAMIQATTRKPFKQKGTGNARQGSKVSAQHRGGGNAHGPRAKKRTRSLNSKATKKAKRMALYSLLSSSSVDVIDSFSLENSKNKTKFASGFINSFCDPKKKCLIISSEIFSDKFLPYRNLKSTSIWKPESLTVHELFKADYLLIEKDSFGKFFNALSSF